MNNKFLKILVSIIVIICFFATGFSVGYITKNIPTIKARISDIQKGSNSAGMLLNMKKNETDSDSDQAPDLTKMFKPFWEAWDLLHAYYVDQPLDDDKLMQGAIKGMVDSLGDPHTRYADPDEYKSEQDMSAGEYEGIGAWVDTSGTYIEITSPIEGSPAEKAGLKAKDLIIAIDGKSMEGVPANDALKKILGPEGSSVVLTIKRGEENPFDVTITRAKIDTPMSSGKMLDSGIAYVQMTQFGDNTTKELRKTLDDLMKKKPSGLILDLRNNGGGYLVSSVESASEFLPADTLVLTEKDGDGTVIPYKTGKDGQRALKIPMVVLVNGGTASAAEILTGALRYWKRAEIIGTKTYGKGSVQVEPELSNGGAVAVTMAHWYTPGDELIDGIGIEPDIKIDITEQDSENGLDPQLDEAEKYLTENNKIEAKENSNNLY